MGTAHKVVSACLRVLEFCLAVVILGILARLFNLIGQLNAPTNSRLVYAISMAAISAFVALVTVPPLKYSFSLFPLDFALFICWIVCYALLQDLAGTRSCSSSWFTNYWTVWWSHANTVVVGSAGCSQWRVVLAFSFIISFVFFCSGLVGAYVCFEYYDIGLRIVAMARKLMFWKKPKTVDLEKNGSHAVDQPVREPLPQNGTGQAATQNTQNGGAPHVASL